jgi:hypothetical protein
LPIAPWSIVRLSIAPLSLCLHGGMEPKALVP